MCNLVLGSHTVNFVMLLDLYYERCFLRKEVSVMMLLSEGSFDAVCATVVSDCGSPILEWPALNVRCLALSGCMPLL